MLKYLILAISFLTFTTITFSQKQGKIVYTTTSCNNCASKPQIFDMWFTNNAYLYQFRLQTPADSPLFQTLKNSPNFDSTEFVNDVIMKTKGLPRINFFGTTKDNVQIQTMLTFETKNCVVDTLAILDWQLQPDTLTIKNIFCQKATCTFKDKVYAAWYAPSIPVALGPQNFQGLPGLLIKLDELTYKKTIEMLELEWPTKDIIKIEPCSGVPYVSKADFNVKQKKIYENINKMMSEKKPITISDVFNQ